MHQRKGKELPIHTWILSQLDLSFSCESVYLCSHMQVIERIVSSEEVYFYHIPTISILDLQSIPWELEENGMAARLVPSSKEVNEILLLKVDQHRRRPRHCKSRIVYEKSIKLWFTELSEHINFSKFNENYIPSFSRTRQPRAFQY
jgi:hypothetical protein